jgi:hypothetical protein
MDSPFVSALRAMLDCGLFSRKEWSKYLFIVKPSRDKIEEWLNEESIPDNHDLNMIFLALEHSSDIPKDVVDKFKEMAQLPAREVSKHGSLMLPTVWEYMKRPMFSELSSKLAKLNTVQEKKDLLESIYP